MKKKKVKKESKMNREKKSSEVKCCNRKKQNKNGIRAMEDRFTFEGIFITSPLLIGYCGTN